MISNPLFKYCKRSAPTSGRSGALWLALLACSALPFGSARADTITQADADRIGAAVVDALLQWSATGDDLSFITYPVNDDLENIGSSLSSNGTTIWDWMNLIYIGLFTSQNPENFHHLFSTWREAWQNASDTGHLDLSDIRSILTTIQQDTDNLDDIDLNEIERALVTIRAAVSGGFSDQNGNLVSHGIQSMLEDQAEYHAGYRTATDAGSWALSVRDDDAITALQDMGDSLSGLPGEVGDAVGDAFNEFVQDGTMRIYVEGLSSSASSSFINTWTSEEQNQLDNLRPGNTPPDTTADRSSAEYAGQSAADEAEAELRTYTGDQNPLPQYTPDTSGLSLDAGNIPTLSVPSLDPHRTNIRVFDGMNSYAWEFPGWASLTDPIEWTPWGDSESDRAGQLLKKAGRVMSGFWQLAFGVWLFLLVRREVVYYVTLGQTDENARTEAVTGEWSTYDD